MSGAQWSYRSRWGADGVLSESVTSPLEVTTRRAFLRGAGLVLGAVENPQAAGGGELTVFGHDHLGSPVVAVRGGVAPGGAQGFGAWGEYRAGAGAPGLGAPGPGELQVGYTGHGWDPETALVYAQARYYAPEIGMFLSEDPFAGELGEPITLGRWGYANGNPLVWWDPDGREPFLKEDRNPNWSPSPAERMAIQSILTAPQRAGSAVGENVQDALGGGVIGGIAGAFADVSVQIGVGVLLTPISIFGLPDQLIEAPQNLGEGVGEAYLGIKEGDSDRALNGVAKAAGAIGTVAGATVLVAAPLQVRGSTPRPSPIAHGRGAASDAAAETAAIPEVAAAKPAAVSEPAPAPTLAPEGGGGAAGGNGAMQPFYPPNDGFLEVPTTGHLRVGERMDRYGGSDYSRFFSPVGTPVEARALPPGAAQQPLRSFEVLKPLEVKEGLVAPAFGEPGLGRQYVTALRLKTLLKKGIIREVPTNGQ